MEESIKAKLKELADNELVELQYTIKHILEEREVSEDLIKETVEYLYSKKGTALSIRYTDLVIYLEKAGLKRDAIAKRVIDMWRKYPRFTESGCPIGETESDSHPIYPIYEGNRYQLICYLMPRWDRY